MHHWTLFLSRSCMFKQRISYKLAKIRHSIGDYSSLLAQTDGFVYSHVTTEEVFPISMYVSVSRA